MIIWFVVILIISLVLAICSMRDFDIPKEIKHLLASRKVKGTIVFFKGKVKHYH